MTYIFLRTQKKCGIFIQLVIWQEKCHYAMFCDKNLDHLVLPKWCMMILFNIFYCLCVNVWVEVYYVKILVNTSNKVFFLIKKKKKKKCPDFCGLINVMMVLQQHGLSCESLTSEKGMISILENGNQDCAETWGHRE